MECDGIRMAVSADVVKPYTMLFKVCGAILSLIETDDSRDRSFALCNVFSLTTAIDANNFFAVSEKTAYYRAMSKVSHAG